MDWAIVGLGNVPKFRKSGWEEQGGWVPDGLCLEQAAPGSAQCTVTPSQSRDRQTKQQLQERGHHLLEKILIGPPQGCDGRPPRRGLHFKL